jgi:IS4 transposase
MLEPTQISTGELAALYAMRWNIEVDFRTLKVAMNMDVLRCKSPDMVKKEIAVYFLTYNLVRWIMVRAAQLVKASARDLSFTSARRLIWAFACHLRQCFDHTTNRLADTLLRSISRCVLPK